MSDKKQTKPSMLAQTLNNLPSGALSCNDTVSPEHELTVIVVNELISRFYRTAMDIDQSDVIDNCHDELVRLLDNSHADLPDFLRRQLARDDHSMWSVEDTKSVNEDLTSYVKNFDAVFNKEWEEGLGSVMKELMHKYIYKITYYLQNDVQKRLKRLEEAQGE